MDRKQEKLILSLILKNIELNPNLSYEYLIKLDNKKQLSFLNFIIKKLPISGQSLLDIYNNNKYPKEELKEIKGIESAVNQVLHQDGYTPQKGIDYFDGKDGQDYVLTEKDKKEIASKIEVPIIEKIIEKTIIKEQPIVNEITKEVIKEVAKTDTGDKIIDKINALPIELDKQIDASHIKNLPRSKGNTLTAYGLTAYGGFTAKDEGSQVAASVRSIDFTGDGVNVSSADGTNITVNVTGGSGTDNTKVPIAGGTMTGVLRNNAGFILRTGTKLIFDGV